jgi:hypothetical protein
MNLKKKGKKTLSGLGVVVGALVVSGCGGGRVRLGDGGLGSWKRRSCCGLSRLGRLLLCRACCNRCRMGFGTASGGEFRHLLVSYRGRRCGSRENLCWDLGDQNGRLRGRTKRELVRDGSQIARGGSHLL